MKFGDLKTSAAAGFICSMMFSGLAHAEDLSLEKPKGPAIQDLAIPDSAGNSTGNSTEPPKVKAPAQPLVQAPAEKPKVKIQIVQPGEFCRRVTNAMTSLSSQTGLDRRDSMRLGGKASAAVIAQLKKGVMNPYMDVKTFQSSVTPDGDRQWFSMPEVLVSSLGVVPRKVLLVDNLSDLKFTSHVMPGSQILVLAKSTADLTPERAKLVAQTAQALGAQINVIWVNKSRDGKDLRAAEGLAFIAAITGGVFLNLSADGTCGQA